MLSVIVMKARSMEALTHHKVHNISLRALIQIALKYRIMVALSASMGTNRCTRSRVFPQDELVLSSKKALHSIEYSLTVACSERSKNRIDSSWTRTKRVSRILSAQMLQRTNTPSWTTHRVKSLSTLEYRRTSKSKEVRTSWQQWPTHSYRKTYNL